MYAWQRNLCGLLMTISEGQSSLIACIRQDSASLHHGATKWQRLRRCPPSAHTKSDTSLADMSLPIQPNRDWLCTALVHHVISPCFSPQRPLRAPLEPPEPPENRGSRSLRLRCNHIVNKNYLICNHFFFFLFKKAAYFCDAFWTILYALAQLLPKSTRF